MEIILLPAVKSDLDYWKQSGSKSTLKKIAQLLKAISETPFEGVGKPESLKHELAGCWSRRINKEHRLIYEILDSKIIVHSARGHY